MALLAKSGAALPIKVRSVTPFFAGIPCELFVVIGYPRVNAVEFVLACDSTMLVERQISFI